MLSEFNQYLLEQIRRQTVLQPTVVAEEIAEILQKHRSTIYKKLKGDTPFLLDEIVAIAEHYHISLDAFFLAQKGEFERIMFDYSLPAEEEHSPVRFLEKICRDIERIAALPAPLIRYATNELPIFHSLLCRELIAFKLYVWSRTNWKLPDMMHRPFDPDYLYERWPEIESLRHATRQAYEKIPGVEYWPRTVLVNILNQIRYYDQAGLFANPKGPERLYQELLEMLGSREELAAAGAKPLEAGRRGGPQFEIYLNEIAFTNNIILIYNEGNPVMTYTTVDNPNFIRSSDPNFCRRMHDWTMQIEACSFSTGSEQHRLSLFGELKKQVLIGVGPKVDENSLFASN